MQKDHSHFNFKFPRMKFQVGNDGESKLDVKNYFPQKQNLIFLDKENEWQQEYYVIYNSYLPEGNRVR